MKKTKKSPAPKAKSVGDPSILDWPLDRLARVTIYNDKFLAEMSRTELERAVVSFIVKEQKRVLRRK